MHHHPKRKGKITPPAGADYWVPALPPVDTLRLVNEHLSEFFDTYQVPDFELAEEAFFAHYASIHPTTEFFRYLDGGRTGGRTFDDGKVHLQHPEDWKRGKRNNSKRLWVRTVIHEWAHYLLYSNAEEKAERFERQFVSAIRKK
jgi:hypothetical protein